MKDDIIIQISTENGTGSFTANKVLSRSLLKAGFNVSAKNLFPSNIAGLPTTYKIRLNTQGFQSVSLKQKIDYFIAFNQKTLVSDLKEAKEKRAHLITKEEFKVDYDSLSLSLVNCRNLTKDLHSSIGVRKLLHNMVYVGAVLKCLNVDLEHGVHSLKKTLTQLKPEIIEANIEALRAGYVASSVIENKKPEELTLGSKNEPKKQIMTDGNTALALGLLDGGAQVFTWYPITPSSSVAETYESFYKKFFKSSNERSVLQCEDELSAVTAALGAGWSGARAVTATSGPGLSLMQESIGLGYFTEAPFVVVDVQRAGPSTGLPTRTLQGDLLSAYYASHGDTIHPVLLPSTVQDCFDDGFASLSLAQDLQTPVFVLSDLDLGMNEWASSELVQSEETPSKGRHLKSNSNEGQAFKRYSNASPVAERSVPRWSDKSLAYFTRGSGHDERGNYSEAPEVFENKLARLKEKVLKGREFSKFFPKDEFEINKDSNIGLIYYGSSCQIVSELKSQLGNASTYKVRALPFSSDLNDFINKHSKIYVIEQNRDGQMCRLLKSEFGSSHLHSVVQFNGHPIDPENILTQIQKLES